MESKEYLDKIISETQEPDTEQPEEKEVELVAWDYDVWGNEEDGFDVNNRFRIERRKVPESTWEDAINDDDKMTELAKDMLRLKTSIKKSDLEFDGDDTVVYINQAKNGYPLGEIEKE